MSDFVSIGGTVAEWVGAGEAGAPGGWYRGEGVNLFPSNRDRTTEGQIDKLYENVLKGWMPPAPILKRSDLVMAIGSCFAAVVEYRLRERGFRTSTDHYGNQDTTNYWSKSLIIKCGEGFVNTHSIRQQFEWMFDDKMPSVSLWKRSEGQIRRYYDTNRDPAREVFLNTDFFIVTLGLAEVWFNKQTGEVLASGVPKAEFDPAVHGFRITTMAENLDNLRAILRLIRQHRGDVPVVFTLSPVPLNATFRPVSCITANSVSKAILRVAVDELMRESTDQNLHYFPAYEIVTSYLADAWVPDLMHPSETAVQTIMAAFMRYFAEP